MRCTHSTCCMNLSAAKITVILLALLTVFCVIIQMKVNFFPKSKELIQTSTRMVKVLTSTGETNITEHSMTYLSACRVKKLRKYCSGFKKYVVISYPNYNQYGSSLTDWIWMTSPYHHLFYCATAKCGSTTWKSYLMKDLKIDWHNGTHE